MVHRSINVFFWPDQKYSLQQRKLNVERIYISDMDTILIRTDPHRTASRLLNGHDFDPERLRIRCYLKGFD